MLNDENRQLLQCESVDTSPFCAVCGRYVGSGINHHHVVQKGMGGTRNDIPTITLCGMGNASGCHGLAHQMRLFFKAEDGRIKWAISSEPMGYQKALAVLYFKEVTNGFDW